MKRPLFIHRWRDFWNPRSTWAEHLARRHFGQEPSVTREKLAEIERERQSDMPAFWVSYAQIAAHILVIGAAIWGAIHYVL